MNVWLEKYNDYSRLMILECMFTSEEPGMSPPGIIVVGPEKPG